jgi:hypothetical protein
VFAVEALRVGEERDESLFDYEQIGGGFIADS